MGIYFKVFKKNWLLMLSTIAFLLLLQIHSSQGAFSNTKPTRVVSINLCTDQLLLQLAERKNIASVTYLASDPMISYFADRTVGIVKNRGLAEEILSLKPDLIFAGIFSSRPTTSLLKKLGHRVIKFEMADNFDSLRSNLIKAGMALKEEAKASRLVATFNRTLNSFPQPQRTVSAFVVQPSRAGAGKVSLLDDILRTAGLKSISNNHGLMGVGWITLDQVIAARPELIISDVTPHWPSLGHLAMRHPAYDAIRDRLGQFPTQITLPANLWNCGGSQSAKAISILIKAQTNVLNKRIGQ